MNKRALIVAAALGAVALLWWATMTSQSPSEVATSGGASVVAPAILPTIPEVPEATGGPESDLQTEQPESRLSRLLVQGAHGRTPEARARWFATVVNQEVELHGRQVNQENALLEGLRSLPENPFTDSLAGIRCGPSACELTFDSSPVPPEVLSIQQELTERWRGAGYDFAFVTALTSPENPSQTLLYPMTTGVLRYLSEPPTTR